MADDTSAAILRAATALLREHPFDDISFRMLAEQVGVSERTVFRQFPTRSHLLEGVAEWIDHHEFTPLAFTSFDEFRAAVRRGYREFDASPAFAALTARAATMSPTGASGRTEMTRMLDELLQAEYPALNARDRQRALAGLRLVAGAPFWARMRSVFDMDADEIADGFDESVTRTLTALRVRPRVSP
ncbi:TetR/AcrR family transcriptional regulator [Microbacteriaceae bacterium VKM Ac-2855]|nr:TetR/AcrR family transcriptional regulator [Microbacteriaceae bacterium VKM Ac-2855]